MFRCFLFPVATVAFAHALSPAPNDDIFLTKTVTNIHYVCPCESSTLWGSWPPSSAATNVWTLSSSTYSYVTSTTRSLLSTSSTLMSTSTNSPSTTTSSSLTSITTTSTQSRSGTSTSTFTTSSTTSAVPSFYFGAYGNGFVRDGTTLGDQVALQYAAFNNASTAFAVNSTGALIDTTNGRIAVVQKNSTSPIIMFVSQAQFNAQTTSVYATCVCSVSGTFLSCNCNGLTVFVAGSDTYLHIQATALSKRSNLDPRQAASSSAVSVSATMASASTSTTSATQTTTTTITSTAPCLLPTPTYVIVTNGSTNEVLPDGTYMHQRANRFFDTGNSSNAYFGNDTDAQLYSINPCTGYLTENKYGNVATVSPYPPYQFLSFVPFNNATFYGPVNFCTCSVNAINNGLSCDCGQNMNILATDSGGQLMARNTSANASLGFYEVYPIARTATTTPTYPTYTASSCASPTPTFTVISNGSGYSSSLQNGYVPYGTPMYPKPFPCCPNNTAGMFGNDTAAGQYSIDPCTGVWTELTTGKNQIATHNNYNQSGYVTWLAPSLVKPDYNAKVCKCNIDSTTTNINCDCGFGRKTWGVYIQDLYSYAPSQDIPSNLGAIQPLAR